MFFKNCFKFFGKNSKIVFPLKINGMANISIGKNVTVNYKTWLAAIPIGSNECKLEIGSGTIIGNFNHIYATEHITIGKNVLTADRVYISDNLHGFEDIHTPIMNQEVKQNGIVTLGDGCWIGENVSILGCSIGKNCVIGSNAVVTKDIPDYCIAVGIPAKVIKKYCFSTEKWIKIEGGL
jgi:acetyltransferase-like isoleucine patch superfamily enzyme